jgi:hypothetical protein
VTGQIQGREEWTGSMASAWSVHRGDSTALTENSRELEMADGHGASSLTEEQRGATVRFTGSGDGVAAGRRRLVRHRLQVTSSFHFSSFQQRD